jgi:Skp family chaperone for outer membrane proteins
MKLRYFTISILLVIFCVFSFYFFKTNIKSETVKAAVIYAQNVKKQSIPFQQFEQYFDKEKAKIHQEFLEKEKELRIEFDNIKKIKKQKGDFLEKKNILHQKVNELNTLLQIKKENFLLKVQEIEKNLHDKLQETIKKIISKYGFNLVLNAELDDKTLVFYADQCFDITSEIILELNKIEFPFFATS